MEHVEADDLEFLGKLTTSLIKSMHQLTSPNPNTVDSASCLRE